MRVLRNRREHGNSGLASSIVSERGHVVAVQRYFFPNADEETLEKIKELCGGDFSRVSCGLHTEDENKIADVNCFIDCLNECLKNGCKFRRLNFDFENCRTHYLVLFRMEIYRETRDDAELRKISKQ